MTPPPRDPYLDWYVRHIPHRVRAAIAGTELLIAKLRQQIGSKNVRPAGYEVRIFSPSDSAAYLCAENAIWEGRLTATRWLIDFVGISCNDGKPGRPRQHRHDWRIDKFGVPFFPDTGADAQKLADVWLGCTKATSHPTRASGHPPVDETELNAAIEIVIKYLETHLYAPQGRSILSDTLRQHPRALVGETEQ